MNPDKRARLESKGWTVGDIDDFLDLDPAETALIAMRVKMALELKRKRVCLGLTQAEAARRIHTSQARLSRVEQGDVTATLDFLVKALMRLDVPQHRLAELMA